MSSGHRIIETVDITKVYGMGEISVTALNGVSITIEAGEFVAIMGQSGSGKSTLMHILGCLSKPTAGQYFLDGEDVSQLDKVQLAGVRNRKIGFIFQSYNLLARTSALRNVTLPLLYDHANPKSLEEADIKATKLLDMVGLTGRINHQPHELSGGQQQRVAIARALIHEPAVVLADEPTASLDTERAFQVVETFATMIREQNRAGIMVTHDLRMVQYVDRVLQMRDGKLAREITNRSEICMMAGSGLHDAPVVAEWPQPPAVLTTAPVLVA
jgi:putative ABC transport system ATP-binding protein